MDVRNPYGVWRGTVTAKNDDRRGQAYVSVRARSSQTCVGK